MTLKSAAVLGLLGAQASIIDLAFASDAQPPGDASEQCDAFVMDGASMAGAQLHHTSAGEADSAERQLNPRTMTLLHNPATGAEVRVP